MKDCIARMIRRHRSLNPTVLRLAGCLLLYAAIGSAAQAATTITPTTGAGNLGTQVLPPSGHVYGITSGNPVGNNLYHSFAQFNVGTGDIAQFQTPTLTPNAAMHNILGRITDTNPSTIFGTIDSATYYPNANLFLMNPYGFLFGPNAMVNVGGMMTFTTADYMRLRGLDGSNAGIFHADTAQTSILTNAPVAAFGFIGSNPHSIDFIGGQLTVASGTGLALVGGDISLTPDSSVVPNLPSSITAPGRPIQMTSVAGPGEVAADTGIPAVGMALGTVTLGQGTTISTVGNLAYGDGSGGTVSIRGGQFVATGVRVLTNPANGTIGQGGEVMITTTGSAAITNATIDTSTIDPKSALIKGGDGGAVGVTASDLTLTNSTILTIVSGDRTAVTPSTGAGGVVTLTGTDSVTLTQSLINTRTTNSNGNSGAVTVTSPIVTLEDSRIVTEVNGQRSVTANGGPVTLGGPGTNSVSMTRSSIITASNETEGNSGSVTITGQTITIGGNGGQQTIVADISSHSGSPNRGNAGDIEITGTNVTFTDSAVVQSVADVEGAFSRGGDIRVNGSQTILLDNGTRFSTSTVSQGNSGNIELTSQHVTITGQSTIGSDTFGPGGGGTITITGTQNIALESGSQVTTSADPGSDGPAGNIELHTPQLTITGGSAVRSQSLVGTGPGGTITVQGVSGPAQSVLISDPGSGIFTDTSSVNLDGVILGTGSGGNIFVNSHSVTLQNGGILSAQTTGIANAGNILVEADSVTVTGGGQLTSSSSLRQTPFFDDEVISPPTGNAGNVSVQGLASPAQSMLIDGPGSGIFTDTQGTGAGGNIFINANSVTLQNGGTLSATTSGTAPSATGGTITVDANQVQLLTGGLITAATTGPGNAGSVTINATDSVTIAGQVSTILPPLSARSRITTTTSGSGDGGDVTITAGQSVSLTGNQSGIFADTTNSGNAGNISITAATFNMNGRARITTETGASTTGNAGSVLIQADQVSLAGNSKITSLTHGSGQGGTIKIAANESISLVDATINSSSDPAPEDLTDAGDGGLIWLSAPTIDLQHGKLNTLTTGIGNAGSVLLEGRTITIGQNEFGSETDIQATTTGAGRGGDITIRGMAGPGSRADDVTISGSSLVRSETSGSGGGQAGNIAINAARLTIDEAGRVTTGAVASAIGNAGTVMLDASETVRINNAVVESNSIEQSQGKAGKVIVAAPTVIVENGGVISTSTELNGNAGSIAINTSNLFMSSGGGITSSSVNVLPGVSEFVPTGAAGNVTVQGQIAGSRANSVLINGLGSGIFTETQGTGAGGNITLNANTVTLQNGAHVTSSSTGTGIAGDITINAGNHFAMTNSSVTTEATQASGGLIKITTDPSGTVQLTNSTISASVLDGKGGGGSVNIDPQYVILLNSQILANAVQGPGGKITINITNGGLYLPDASSTVSASSRFGVNGTVTIQSPNAPISGQIQPLGKTPLIATSLLNQHCASLAGGEFSSFTVAGRDSLPTEPGGWLSSPLATLSGGMGLGIKAEGVKPVVGAMSASAGQVASGQWRVGDRQILSLRQIAPAGFLTQAFAVDWSASCKS